MKALHLSRRASALLVLGAALALVAGGCGSGTPKIGSVAGTVLDDLGNPVAAVRITVGALFADTDALGGFTVTGVSTGAHSVAAAKAGYTFTTQSVMVPGGGTVTTAITGSRANNAPLVDASATPTTVTFVGGTATLLATVTDADNDAVTVTLTGPDGAVALTDLGSGQYRAAVPLAANNSLAPLEHNYQFTANDGRATTRATVTVTVNGLQTPGDVDGGDTPEGGGPDVPNI